MIGTAPALQDSEIVSKANRALAKAFLLRPEAGLRLPPVPLELADRLHEQAEWWLARADSGLPVSRLRLLWRTSAARLNGGYGR